MTCHLRWKIHYLSHFLSSCLQNMEELKVTVYMLMKVTSYCYQVILYSHNP